MNTFRSPQPRFSGIWHLLFGVLLMTSGCQESEEIRTYQVPKSEKLSQPKTTASTIAGRMLGGIIFHGSQAWFFKMSGPDAAVQDQMEEFLAFTKSIRFENDKPVWDTPTGWSQKPGNEFRFATLTVDGSDPPLETSVTMLPHDVGSEDESLLANINRWRGQLELPPTTADQLYQEKSKTEEVIRDKTNAGDDLVLVNLAGQISESGGMTPPFAGGGGPFSGPMRPSAPTAPAETTDSDIKFDLPEGWEKAELRTFQVAAFRVRKNDQKVDISLTPLSGAAGGLLPNVNRWRGQINLPAIDEQQLNAEMKQLPVGEATAQYIEIVGSESADPQQAIWSAILEQGDQTWFIKLQGDLALAREEQSKFESFVKSIRFE
ncbi:MAG: hypothetical protein O2955_04565 [Planctomycetota bacterium]|nr:hypothetical protein [Planctomycetota bacterium]MDA1211763.1 hypothetical protein [Planctomycetota bacterium]